MAHAPAHPGSRIYAQRPAAGEAGGGGGGGLAGYIGSHEPIQWDGQGTAVPFGFPWTYPIDPGLEVELYDRMIRATPEVYAGRRADFYVQRFRASWGRQHAFVRSRGWREFCREPIFTTSLVPPPLSEA